MNPFNINPDNIAREINSFGNKLTQGLNTLSALGEIDVGVSAKDCVYEEDKLNLYRYQSRCEKPCPVPLLIVYALVNRPYMAAGCPRMSA